MEYKKYIISFIDILGSTHRINTFTVNQLVSQYKLFSNLNENDHWYGSAINECKINKYDRFVFSDLIVRTIDIEKVENNIGWAYFFAVELCNLAEIQYKLFTDFTSVWDLHEKSSPTLLRGCINLGKLYIDSEQKIIFGDGLIDCYNKESKLAVYPRIMVDDSLLKEKKELNLKSINFDRFLQNEYMFTHQFNTTLSCIRKDYDGIHFLDYLKLYILTNISIDEFAIAFLTLQKHAYSISSIAKNEIYKRSPKDKQKLNWLINYHNSLVNEYVEFAKEATFTDYNSEEFENLKIQTSS